MTKDKITLSPDQQDALEKILDFWHKGGRTLTMGGLAGCHRAGQPVLMYDGSVKRVEDVVIGDRLMGPDSFPRTVLALAGGHGQMAEIHPVKGAPWTVNMDHILTVRMVCPYPQATVDVSVRDWLSWPSGKKKASKLLRAAVSFPRADSLPVDPYFLGVLIGDGCFLNGVSVSKPGTVVRELCEAQAPLFGVRVRPRPSSRSCPSYHFSTGRFGRRNGKNGLIEALRALDLYGLGSGNKFIPAPYKTASRESRLAMLAGIMDTDGSVSCGGFDYITKSEKLAEDVSFLARSLGFACYPAKVRKCCQGGFKGEYWHMSISGDCSAIPTRIKVAPPRRQIKNVLHDGFSVVPLRGAETFYGFSLDGDGRFLLGDFTITHNTGKSFVIAEASRALRGKSRRKWRHKDSDIAYAAYTGKAGDVLRRKLTAADAMRPGDYCGTIHGLIYEPKFVDGQLAGFKKRDFLDYDLLVIDEASMVTREIDQDLRSYNVPILYVGDHGQLPPIGDDFNLMGDPEIRLEKIHRQAESNPIIRLSMMAREEGRIPLGQHGEGVLKVDDLNIIDRIEDPHKALILCGWNGFRSQMNRKIRGLQGIVDPDPVVGERVICLRNNREKGVFNGMTGTLASIEVETRNAFRAEIDMDGGERYSGLISRHQFGEEKTMMKIPGWTRENPIDAWDWGYCLTVHKAQGSEARRVVLFEQRSQFMTEDIWRRWLYTGCTRSSERLLIVGF